MNSLSWVESRSASRNERPVTRLPIVVPEDVALTAVRRRQHLGEHLRFEALEMPSDVERIAPTKAACRPAPDGDASRGVTISPPSLGRPVHRIAAAAGRDGESSCAGARSSVRRSRFRGSSAALSGVPCLPMIIEAPTIRFESRFPPRRRYRRARARLRDSRPRKDFAERASVSAISAASVGRLMESSSRASRSRRLWSAAGLRGGEKVGWAASMVGEYYHTGAAAGFPAKAAHRRAGCQLGPSSIDPG